MPDAPPFDPRAISNLLLEIADQNGISVTHLALQKLLYFAHGHFLIETGVPLVHGAFEAWTNGPVHPAVYQAFKGAGREPIHHRAVGRNVLTGETRELELPSRVDVRRHISKVVLAYGGLSPGLLVAISHAPRGPWATVRARAVRGGIVGNRISDSITAECFRYQKIAVNVGVEQRLAEDDRPLHLDTTIQEIGK